MFLTLDELVREYLIEIGEQSLHKKMRYLQFGINGLREFNFDTTGIAKPVVLPVNSNDTVDLPNDFIDYIRIGICGFDGIIQDLAENKNICFPRATDDCGDILPDEVSGGTVVIDFFEGGQFRNNEFIGRRFGQGGGSPGAGSYRINERDGYISLQGLTGANVILEYMADIEKNDKGNFTVHPFIVQALKSWMAWQAEERRPKPIPSLINSKWLTFKREKRIAKRRLVSPTIQEAKNVIRKHFTMTVKT